jgi:hypothetical protein
MRSLGGAAGTAVYTSIFQSKAASIIPVEVSAAAIADGLPTASIPEFLGILTGEVTTLPITDVPGVTPAIIGSSSLALKQAYVAAFRYVWLTSIAFGVLALISAASTIDVSVHSNPCLGSMQRRLRIVLCSFPPI